MSEVCWISAMKQPPQMAWIRPAGRKNTSPGCTSWRASTSVIVPSATRFSYSSGVISCVMPARRWAPGSAATTYHISVFPLEPLCRTAASSSFGWTWMDRSLRASMNLISRGNSSPVLAYTCSPTRQPLYSFTSSAMVFPARAPFATTDSFPFTPDSSQLSPICSCVVSTPL